MMMEEPNRKEIAAFFATGLLAGIIAPAAAIRWADSIIESDDKPDIEFIDVSLSGSRGVDKVVSALRNVRGEMRPGLSDRLIAAYCGRKLRHGDWSFAFACDALGSLMRMVETEEIEWMLAGLEDDFSLARDGIAGTAEEALSRTREYYDTFKEYEHLLPSML